MICKQRFGTHLVAFVEVKQEMTRSRLLRLAVCSPPELATFLRSASTAFVLPLNLAVQRRYPS